MAIVVSTAQTQSDYFQLIRLREEVFVIEQGIPLEIELDDHDDHALHVIAKDGRQVVGTARLVVNESSGKIGRMAVKQRYRRQQIGHALMKEIQCAAREQRLSRLILHAQEPAVNFFRRFGFQPEGDRFDEGGRPHRKMVKEMNGSSSSMPMKKAP